MALNVIEQGRGDTVLLLHGWPASVHLWRKMIAPLAAKHRVIAIDLPGIGGSAPPSAYDKITVARELHATLKLGPLSIVAHDIGAAVAYAYAKLFPVEKLVLLDDPIPGLKGWDAMKVSRWHFAFNALKELPEKLVAGRQLDMFGWFYDNAVQKAAITDADRRTYAEAYASPSQLHAGFEYYRAFDADAKANAADTTILETPVLAIGGDHSPYKTFTHDQLEGRVRHLEGDVAPDCGHFVPEEQPAWLVERIERFLAT